MSAAQGLPTIARSRPLILPSVGPLRQFHVPPGRSYMSGRFPALARHTGAIVIPRRRLLMPDRDVSAGER
jgi:hypothetical protein